MKQTSRVYQTPSSKGDSENIEGTRVNMKELRMDMNIKVDYFERNQKNKE